MDLSTLFSDLHATLTQLEQAIQATTGGGENGNGEGQPADMKKTILSKVQAGTALSTDEMAALTGYLGEEKPEDDNANGNGEEMQKGQSTTSTDTGEAGMLQLLKTLIANKQGGQQVQKPANNTPSMQDVLKSLMEKTHTPRPDAITTAFQKDVTEAFKQLSQVIKGIADRQKGQDNILEQLLSGSALATEIKKSYETYKAEEAKALEMQNSKNRPILNIEKSAIDQIASLIQQGQGVQSQVPFQLNQTQETQAFTKSNNRNQVAQSGLTEFLKGIAGVGFGGQNGKTHFVAPGNSQRI